MKFSKNPYRKKIKGFTLVELLFVIVIMAILATMAVVIFNRGNYSRKNNDQIRSKDINELANALEEFKADRGHYPYVNWNGGKHGWEALGNTTACDSTNINYKPSLAEDPNSFKPGTRITLIGDEPCDDLSLQLLGKAYLTSMPSYDSSATAAEKDASVQGQGEWQDLSASPRPYINKIPKDPLYGTMSCGGSSCAKENLDYVPTQNDKFYYRYNSFYNCNSESIGVGSRYWLYATMQNSKNHDSDTSSGLYYYEVGNINHNQVCVG